MTIRILVINPGSTSTKIGLFESENIIFERNISHSNEVLAEYSTIAEQMPFRKNTILNVLEEENIELNMIDAYCGRGGLLRAIPGGTYYIDGTMLKDLKSGYNGQHASNLGGILAFELGEQFGKPSFIVDPVVVDELDEVARITGIKEIQRKSIFHALNQKAVARKYANEINTNYENINVIVAHLGGGITVGAHKKGRVIDVLNGLDGEGPFSPERAGSIPTGELIELCFSGKYSRSEIDRLIVGNGGLMNYFQTNDAREVVKEIHLGNKEAELVFEAMSYRVAKEIGAQSVVLQGKIDAIILTGGLANNELFIKKIIDRVNWLGEVVVYPGEDELPSLALGALRVLLGEEKPKKYEDYIK